MHRNSVTESFKINFAGAKEMAQQLRSICCSLEDLGSVSSTEWCLNLTPVLGDPMFFGLCRHQAHT